MAASLLIENLAKQTGGVKSVPPGSRPQVRSGSFSSNHQAMQVNRSTSNRILFVAPEPFYSDRGTPIAVKHVITALTESGYAVDLLTYPMGKPFEQPGLRIFRIANPLRIRKVPIGFSIRKVLLDTFLLSSMWKRLSSERYTCIHAVEEAAFPAVMAGRRHRVPVIYDMQSSLPEQLKTYRLFRGSLVQQMLLGCERWLIGNVDLVVCSAGLERYVRKVDPRTRVMQWFFPGQRVEVDASEVMRLRENLEIASESPVVLYTGNSEPYQELHKLIDAAVKTRACFPKTVFVLVGVDASDGFATSNEAKTLLKDGTLRLLHRQPKSELPKFLALADVVVSPRAESGNLPMKVFDYLAAGRPIVAVDTPTNRTVLDDNRALLVDEQIKGLGGAIIQLLQEPETSHRLGEAARVYAEEHLGWKTFLELVNEVQIRAAGSGRKARGRESLAPAAKN